MATLDQLLDGDRVDRISAEAREVHFGRVLLTIVAAVLFGIGWVAYKVCRTALLALAWCAVAVKVGWQDARADGARGPA